MPIIASVNPVEHHVEIGNRKNYMSQRVMITFNHAGPDDVLVHRTIIVRVELLVQFLHRSMEA